MRFSLATLLIFLLWFGAMIGVWVRRSPWVKDARVYAETEVDESRTQSHGWYSPDGTRIAFLEGDAPVISDRTNIDNKLFIFPYPGLFGLVGFVDDNTLLLCNPGGFPLYISQYVFWHRRYLEWWWGHFYRPEVWLAIVFGALWIWRIVRWYRMRRSMSF